MSYYDTSDYEYSFYLRTIKNLEFIQNREKEEKDQGKTDQEIQDAFEVTQLINSFVGLLIIPRERCFKNLQNDDMFPRGSDAEKLFFQIMKGHGKCKNTFRKRVYNPRIDDWEITKEIERVTPKFLVLKLRNAVAHDRLKIQPISPGKNGVITGIEFSDVKYNKKEKFFEEFKLTLSIEETEILVKALAELLVSYYPKKARLA